MAVPVKSPDNLASYNSALGATADLSRLPPEGRKAAEALSKQGYDLQQTAVLAPRPGEWPYGRAGGSEAG